MSLVAVTPSGDVVGACLNGSHEPGHQDEMEAEANNCPNPKFRKILQLLVSIERRANVFGKFPEIKKLLEVRIVAVDSKWRGKGIATSLLETTKQMAPEWGFSLLKVDCTSAFSALAMTKLQAQCVFCMSYADYCSPESGEPVFEPEPPHSTVKTYVQILSPRITNRSNNYINQNGKCKKEDEVLDR